MAKNAYVAVVQTKSFMPTILLLFREVATMDYGTYNHFVKLVIVKR